MMDKLLEKKEAVEKKMVSIAEARMAAMETMKKAQQTLSELRDDDLKTDGEYHAVCELLGLDAKEEFTKVWEAKVKKEEKKAEEKAK